MSGRKVWVANDILAADDVNSYLMDQSLMVFADSSTRLSEIPSPVEGMVTYLTGSNVLEVWTGSSWVGSNSVGGSVAGSQVSGSITTATLPGSQVTGSITTATINASGVINTLTASTAITYTFQSTDQGQVLRFTAAGTVTATIGTATALTAGQRIDVLADGAAGLQILAGTGVTLAGAGTAGTTYSINQYDAATIMAVASNTYRIIGNITAV
jgi:hypothetical protein